MGLPITDGCHWKDDWKYPTFVSFERKMKKIHILLLMALNGSFLIAQNDYSAFPVYEGNDLGLHYSADGCTWKVWSPSAESVQVLLFAKEEDTKPSKVLPMIKEAQGVWKLRLEGNLKGTFYAFTATHAGKKSGPFLDPYAKAVGTNGKKAVVFDVTDTHPQGWEQDRPPAFSDTNAPTDAVIYELHVRDVSIHASSGIRYKGKFLGLAEENTRTEDGQSTGLKHLRDLGVTHVHLLPSFDYNSVDESKPDEAQYNWGYDPLNYNAPEGSYSTHPADGITRIREMKQMVMAMHRNGLSVVMDVVYNHTALTGDSYFNQLVPGYYYRQNDQGAFSDASGCGNEVASDRYMVRKMMIESLVYWVKEYHIDGFRFDLMGIHDLATMNAIADTLQHIRPGILLYGEGWTAGGSPLPEGDRAIKKQVSMLNNIAVFGDDLRDGIKGSVFDDHDTGFASGKSGNEESIKFGVVACGVHPQVNMEKVNYSRDPYTTEPSQVVAYCECHDNLCLWDKLAVSVPNASDQQRKDMHKLALAIVLTSQGIPFLHAGTEFLRTKQKVENSYKSPDSINAIDWTLKKTNADVFQFVQGLIQLRKAHPVFRMPSAELVAQAIRFDATLAAGVVAYTMDGKIAGDSWPKVRVVYNGSAQQQKVSTEGCSSMAIQSNDGVFQQEGQVVLPPHTMAVLHGK
jgi:pullulanase